jgi:hypothetical protein
MSNSTGAPPATKISAGGINTNASVSSSTGGAVPVRARRRAADGCYDPARQRGQRPGMHGVRRRDRNEKAAIGQVPAGKKLDRLTRCGRVLGNQRIDEEKLDQQRHVADELDVARGKLCQQPVARKAREADERAQHRRGDDADQGDAQRVRNADRQRLQIGIGCAVREERGLADRKARLPAKECKAARDLALREMRNHASATVAPTADAW